MDGTIIGHVTDQIHRTHNELYQCLFWIPYMNLGWRKLWVDVCQSNYSFRENFRLNQAFYLLIYKYGPPCNDKATMTDADFDLLDKTIRFSRLYASILSIHLRSESSLISDDGSMEALKEGIAKELKAARTPREVTIDFHSLFSPFSKVPWSKHTPIRRTWMMAAHRIRESFKGLCKKWNNRLLYPTYNRRRNISRDSCQALCSTGYRVEERHPCDYTTMDLERHYHRTGEMVEGIAEVRWAWKYSELKPRVYYCTGGTQYWASRYVKPIAVDFMESVPMTKLNRRRFPDSVSNYMRAGNYVVIWDYSSFTSQLAEAREFLYWCCRWMSDDPFIRAYPCKLVDVWQGIVEKPLWEMLDYYNDTANVCAMADLNRLQEYLDLDEGEMANLEMANNGMLGVHGNIGFSTTTAGIHTTVRLKDPELGAGLGDDILCVDDEDPESSGLLDHITDIGAVPREKFGIYGPDTEERGWKFVKRPLRVYDRFFTIGEQLSFPQFAYVFAIDKGHRKFPDKKDIGATIHRFCGQMGSFLWEYQMSWSDAKTVDDLMLLERLFASAYRHLGLPFDGALPGYRIPGYDPPITLGLALPSIRFTQYDPASYDWAEYLWDSSPQSFAILPLTVASEIPLELWEVGRTFTSTSSHLATLMEDLGYIEKSGQLTEAVVVSENNKRRFRSLLNGQGSTLYNFKWLMPPPSIYYDVTNNVSRNSLTKSGPLPWGSGVCPF